MIEKLKKKNLKFNISNNKVLLLGLIPGYAWFLNRRLQSIGIMNGIPPEEYKKLGL